MALERELVVMVDFCLLAMMNRMKNFNLYARYIYDLFQGNVHIFMHLRFGSYMTSVVFVGEEGGILVTAY